MGLKAKMRNLALIGKIPQIEKKIKGDGQI